ncbi:MAG: V-type ATP synthase subunit E, partial [Thermoanaerobaculia bacterium]
EEAARRVYEARAEALRRILEAREAALERVFEAAREELEAALAGDRRDPILERLLAEALACFGDTPVLVRCPPGFQGPVQEAVDRLAAAPGGDRPRAGREIRVVEDPAVAGGVVVTSPDRRLEVDATLPGRLSALRPELAMDVAAHLEEPS